MNATANEVDIFAWQPQHWMEAACERLPRNLTQAEWQQYFPGEEYRSTCPNLSAGN